MTFSLLDTIVLRHDLPQHSLEKGDIGAIVEHYGEAFEVEFITAGGQTQAVVTLSPSDVRSIGDRDVLAVRPLPRSA